MSLLIAIRCCMLIIYCSKTIFYQALIVFCKPYIVVRGSCKSSATNRFSWFYPRYILKCFSALEWCVQQLKIPVYFVQIAFQLTELFQIEIDAVIYTDQFACYNKKRPSKGWLGVHLLHDNASSNKCEVLKSFWLLKR